MTVNQLFYSVMFLLLSTQTRAQEPIFTGGVVGGLNFSSLTKESVWDYCGTNTGIRITADVGKIDLGMELLYSVNGEYILPDYYPSIDWGKIRLTHIEIPVYALIPMPVYNKNFNQHWQLTIGGAFTQLLSYFGQDKQGIDQTSTVKYSRTHNFILQAGTFIYLTPKFGVNWRISVPVQQVLDVSMAFRVHYDF